MKTRLFLPVLAVLFAAFTLVSHALAQSANVKPPNKNLSAKFKSGIFKGSGNLIGSNSIASFIGGGQSNTIFAASTNGVIGGGFGNVASNHFATVGGGLENTASAHFATVGGGRNNTASDMYATVGGGDANWASGVTATLGGGSQNTASGDYAVVAGGDHNTANAAGSTVGGGFANKAVGLFATVPGGNNNTATNSAFAAGEYAIAEHEGSFVWGSSAGILVNLTRSFASNTFTVRAAGGARFYTAGSGTNAGVVLTNLATSWASLSDSNSKTDFAPIKPKEILSRVAAMPVTSWHYKHDLRRRYIGPMAQDFHAAFGLGSDDKSISTLDSDGVMYAAIQGLVEELKERDQQMADRDAKIGELEAKSAEIDQLKIELRAIREQMSQLPPAR